MEASISILSNQGLFINVDCCLIVGSLCLFLCQCELSKGGLFSSLISRLWGDKEVRILILGLDNAGKTTILYRLQVCVAFFFFEVEAKKEAHALFLGFMV